jgi:aldehyde dehydrogenase (NAD+)
MRRILIANGLDPHLLVVLDERAESASDAIRRGVDKVFLTGSAETGRKVLRQLADPLIPSVMELSGCDAVFILDGADLPGVVEALVFALRLNNAATCMAPRRLFVSERTQSQLQPLLTAALRRLKPIDVSASTRQLLGDLIAEATLYGAKVALNGLHAVFPALPAHQPPAHDPPAHDKAAHDPLPHERLHHDQGKHTVGATVITGAQPAMRIAQADIFAPVLSIFTVRDTEEALRLHEQCPYALTAAVFGPRDAAEALAARVNAGTVLLNDLIVATADPRAAFSARKRSGFGSTRGAEGLLEMTAVKTVIRRRAPDRRAYQPTTPMHTRLFTAYISLAHGRGWKTRLAALRGLIQAASQLK